MSLVSFPVPLVDLYNGIINQSFSHPSSHHCTADLTILPTSNPTRARHSVLPDPQTSCTYLLYPSHHASIITPDLLTRPHPASEFLINTPEQHQPILSTPSVPLRALTLVLIDATWTTAKRIYRQSTYLQSLPTLCLPPHHRFFQSPPPFQIPQRPLHAASTPSIEQSATANQWMSSPSLNAPSLPSTSLPYHPLFFLRKQPLKVLAAGGRSTAEALACALICLSDVGEGELGEVEGRGRCEGQRGDKGENVLDVRGVWLDVGRCILRVVKEANALQFMCVTGEEGGKTVRHRKENVGYVEGLYENCQGC